MAPNVKDGNHFVEKKNEEDEFVKLVAPQASPWKYQWLYFNVAFLTIVHILALYGIYLCPSARYTSLLFVYLCWLLGNIGITAGTHRLWSHRAYKANLPLQILLMLMHSMTFQTSVINWVQTHRRHHKFSDTDGDPHNATRGFFFSHMGWLMMNRHPECVKRRKCVDISDVMNNPVLQFQKRYSSIVLPLMSFVIPTGILVLCFGESLNVAWNINMLRLVMNLHAAAMINSIAHLWGSKPYDKNIQPTQNLTATLCTAGEGFHNYHHSFPWDYKAAELGNNWLNPTTLVIDFFAWLGWAYDLQTVAPDIVAKRMTRAGDGSNSWGIQKPLLH